MSYSDDLAISSDDEKVMKHPTVNIKPIGKAEFNYDNMSEELEKMDKKQLVKLVTSFGQHELRNTNF